MDKDTQIYKSKSKFWIKAISCILIIAFLWQDVMWANPEIASSLPKNNALQIQTLCADNGFSYRAVGGLVQKYLEGDNPLSPVDVEKRFEKLKTWLNAAKDRGCTVADGDMLTTEFVVSFSDETSIRYYNPRTHDPIPGIPVTTKINGKKPRYLHKQVIPNAPSQKNLEPINIISNDGSRFSITLTGSTGLKKLFPECEKHLPGITEQFEGGEVYIYNDGEDCFLESLVSPGDSISIAGYIKSDSNKPDPTRKKGWELFNNAALRPVKRALTKLAELVTGRKLTAREKRVIEYIHVPLAEESVMILCLGLGFEYYLIARLIWVVLHPLLNKAPPGMSRFSLEYFTTNVTTPVLISLISLSPAFLAFLSFPPHFIALFINIFGIFTHGCFNYYISTAVRRMAHRKSIQKMTGKLESTKEMIKKLKTENFIGGVEANLVWGKDINERDVFDFNNFIEPTEVDKSIKEAYFIMLLYGIVTSTLGISSEELLEGFRYILFESSEANLPEHPGRAFASNWDEAFQGKEAMKEILIILHNIICCPLVF